MDELPQQEPNNLKKFGKEFQAKCISILLSDRTFLERIVDILSPDYFETDAQKWIVQLIMEYFPKYKALPTLDVFKVHLQSIADPVAQTAIHEQIKAAYRHISSTDITFIKEQFLDFCKTQKLKAAVFASMDLVKSGDYDSIKVIMDNALKAGSEKNIGHDYIQDVDKRMSAMMRETIKTNWEILDTHMDGGLGKGELGFIVAPAGSGKSWFLARIGAEAMRQGKNVMHFTMELNEQYVGLRYDACFSGISFQDVRKNIDKVKDEISKIPGKLFIKYFPLKTASAATLKMHIDRLQLVTGVKIDLIIVDYADILRPFSQNSKDNSYEESGNVYEELRTILGELQIPGWTASQSNRGAHEKEVTEAGDVADSYRKIMTGDFIMSLSRRMEDKMAGTGRLYVMKNRFGPDGISYPCNFDASNGQIGVFDKASVEGMEILNKSKNAQESLKDIFRKRWKEAHGEGGVSGDANT